MSTNQNGLSSETATELSPESPCEMIVSGTIAADPEDRNKLILTTDDGCQFRAAPIDNLVVKGSKQWRVIPLTQSDGEISKMQILGWVELDSPLPDSYQCLGRVVQIGKKHTAATFKMSRPNGQVTLRHTILNPPAEMQIEEKWRVVARREGKYLKIVTAICQESPRSNTSIGSKTGNIPAQTFKKVISLDSNVDEGEVRFIATAALDREIKEQEWQLTLCLIKGKVWEWEAQSITSPHVRGRVQVDVREKIAQVYLYPDGSLLLPGEEIEEPAEIDGIAEIVKPEDRLIVTPLGAARGIGASCFRVQIGPYEIVMDAGTRPKGSDPLPAFELLNRPNLLLVTHAHLDHLGAVPVFHRQFPDVPMICTHGTREIARVMLTDGLKVQTYQQQQNEDFQPLYDGNDLDRTLFHLQTQPVGINFSPLPGLIVRFVHAGHIVGAACIYMEYGNRSLFYTGDYNTTSSRTAEGLKLADLPKADMLITESTYGGDTHPSRKSQESELIEAVMKVVQAGGNVLIPAFALGRAQEIILALRTSPIFMTANVPVYVDGLVREITDLFQNQLDLLPKTVRNFAKTQTPFFNEKSSPHIISVGGARERPLAVSKPSVVIASSGMLSGGASMHYAKMLLERENAAIFISGYTDEESPGRFLQTLQPGEEIEFDGAMLTVRATIQRFNLSAHADRVGITQVIHRVAPQHLILIHGSKTALHELSRAGDLREKYWIHIPEVGDEITFDKPPEHLSKVQIARVDAGQEFEIEIEAEYDGAWLRIADTVLEDPRWQNLSATGLLSAKWTRAGLLLKPANFKGITVDAAIATGLDCCAVCGFFDGRICRGEESPLYKRDVDPFAKCGEFEPSVERLYQQPIGNLAKEEGIESEDNDDLDFNLEPD
jgi:Cft2 family RNA processing exonuclease